LTPGRVTTMSSLASHRPLISVIMANFAGGQYIERALDSVLAQTMSDIEVIVSDDSSPDDSVMRVIEIQRRDPRVRLVLAEENGGPARCHRFDDAPHRCGTSIAKVACRLKRGDR